MKRDRNSSHAIQPRYSPQTSIRLTGYDYASPGAYFITICTHDRVCWFGEVVDGEMRLNELGQVVADTWQWLAVQHPYVELDEWVVMPNHFHEILVITDPSRRGGSRTAPTLGTAPQPLATAPTLGTAPQPLATVPTLGTAPQPLATAPTLGTAPQPLATAPQPLATPSQPSDDRTKIESLGRLIGAFKTVSTKQINQIRKTPATPIWQRNYYERIIRNERALHNIRQYIVMNPASW